jgi:hypothetical protein
MQLNETTMAVLKNFATIQENVVLTEGNVIKTIADAKNVMAFANLEQSFDKSVGIYNLAEFLNVLSLVDDPDLTFNEDFVTVSGNGRSQVKYFYSDVSVLTAPPEKDIVMPSTDVQFTLDEGTLGRVRKAAAALGHEKMTITPDDGGVKLSVVDNTDATSNAFEISVPGSYDADQEFCFVMNISNMKLIAGDYDVEISQRLLSHFKNKNVDVRYFIALEKSSTFGA